MDPADLDALAWRAVELAVQQRRDPRLIVATKATIAGPAAIARLMAGLCNAAGGRRVVALFGVDGARIVGVGEPPADGWLDTIAEAFPGVVPTLSTSSIDADGACLVVLAADDPGTPVVATRRSRAIIPWFDGKLRDRPPQPRSDEVRRPSATLVVRAGWLENTDAPAPGGAEAARIGVWRGVVDVAMALGMDRRTGAIEAGLEGETDADDVVIDDDGVSVTLLAEGSASALSLDAQIHPVSGVSGVVRTATGVRIDPMVWCRLYLAAAVDSLVFARRGRRDETVRLLISVRLPDEARLAATMVALVPDPGAPTGRWVV